MNAQELEYAAKILFPAKHWKRSVADALDVNRVTVWRWVKDDYVPPDKQKAIFNLVKLHLKAETALLKHLRGKLKWNRFI